MKSGSIALIPTDTLYGLAVDADSAEGIDKIYRLKGRDFDKPLILFINEPCRLVDLSISTDSNTGKILNEYWPGALTAVFPIKMNILRNFKYSTIGIRIPNYPDLLKILGIFPGFFLTTSANKSGQEPMNDPKLIMETFGDELDWILDAGHLPDSQPSTVADFTSWPPRILRAGKTVLKTD